MLNAKICWHQVWEIGNEVYGNRTYGSTWEYDVHVKSPTTYAKNVVAYSQAMKAVDPSIRVGVVLTTPDARPDGQTASRRRSPGTPWSCRLPAPPSTS
jgi:hypothetical protein